MPDIINTIEDHTIKGISSTSTKPSRISLVTRTQRLKKLPGPSIREIDPRIMTARLMRNTTGMETLNADTHGNAKVQVFVNSSTTVLNQSMASDGAEDPMLVLSLVHLTNTRRKTKKIQKKDSNGIKVA